MRRIWMISLLILLLGFVIASRYYPKIVYASVSGNHHYTAKDVLQLANLSVGDPFFWVTKQKIDQLEVDPWIIQATVVRDFPNAVHIHITEREPILSDGVHSYAVDGRVLPGVSAAQQTSLIKLKGWGATRFTEVVELVKLLAQHDLEVISYTPAGFTLQFATTEIFTPSVEDLKDHWASALSQQGKRLSVYPWGVSKVHE